MLKIPNYRLLRKNRDAPNRRRVLARHEVLNEHGTAIEVMLSENWPGTRWWVSAVREHVRMTNGIETSSRAKALAWRADIEAGAVEFVD